LPLQVIGRTTLFGPFWYNIREMTDIQNVQNIHTHYL